MSKTFIAVYEHGPKWIEGQPQSAQPLEAHLEYLICLHKSGQVVMGGPFEDDSGGLVLLTVDDLSEAKQLIARDPAIVAGILKVEVHAWNQVVSENRYLTSLLTGRD